jgi:hypothetical protein
LCGAGTLARGRRNQREHDFGNTGRVGFAGAINYTYLAMPKAAPKSKSASDTLVDSVTRLRAEAKERMSEEEFRQADEKVHQLAIKVRASRGRKRETA